MCSKIGVDPLASNKGFWSELLDVGDFYYELGVQIIEIGILTRFVCQMVCFHVPMNKRIKRMVSDA